MKMKKIGIDARLYFQTGVGTYIRNLLHYLSQLHEHTVQYYVYVLPKDVSNIHLPHDFFLIRPVDAPWHSLREQIVFYSVLIKDNLDLMHFTYFSYPIGYSKPFIATVHDVTPLLFKTGRASTLNPLWYEIKHQVFKFVLSSQIRHARAIITPTKAVKNQMGTIYGSDILSKIYPLYEGVNHELMNTKSNLSLGKKYSKPFYLYVGNFYPHKNVNALVEVWKDMKDQLVLVGPDNMFARKLKNDIAIHAIKHIRFVPAATIEDLAFFYTHAKALINPSLSEGFGLPLIEATYFGCPVIASDIPVFKELLGDHYISFDPQNSESIGKALRSEKLSKVPVSILKKLSFEKMAKDTLEIYKKHF